MTDTRKRSVTLSGHRTSVSLEPAFWEALKEIAQTRKCSINDLIADIDRERSHAVPLIGLSSAVRVHILTHYRDKAAKA